MEKFIPYEKLSKKEKRKMDLAKRQTWGELNPVTRKPENSKAYNRRKAQSWKRDSSSVPFHFSIYQWASRYRSFAKIELYCKSSSAAFFIIS